MTIASEITDLQTNLAAAKAAVAAAGGTVGNTGLAGLASEIATIPTGGGGSFLAPYIIHKENDVTISSATTQIPFTMPEEAVCLGIGISIVDGNVGNETYTAMSKAKKLNLIRVAEGTATLGNGSTTIPFTAKIDGTPYLSGRADPINQFWNEHGWVWNIVKNMNLSEYNAAAGGIYGSAANKSYELDFNKPADRIHAILRGTGAINGTSYRIYTTDILRYDYDGDYDNLPRLRPKWTGLTGAINQGTRTNVLTHTGTLQITAENAGALTVSFSPTISGTGPVGPSGIGLVYCSRDLTSYGRPMYYVIASDSFPTDESVENYLNGIFWPYECKPYNERRLYFTDADYANGDYPILSAGTHYFSVEIGEGSYKWDNIFSASNTSKMVIRVYSGKEMNGSFTPETRAYVADPSNWSYENKIDDIMLLTPVENMPHFDYMGLYTTQGSMM